MPADAAIFDVDGTLVDSVDLHARAWQEAFAYFGRRVPLARLVEYAHRRHWVEQYHEEAKTLLGWDQYQGRLWTGFHRHSVLVMLAYSFLVQQEWQGRQRVSRRGRKRRPFSPSARPPAGAAA